MQAEGMRRSGGIDLHAASDEKSRSPRQSLRWSRTFARLHHKKEAPADDRRTQKQKEALIMDKVQRMKQQKQYEDYVKKKTPRHNVWLNMLKAFLLGGTICFLGQVIYHYCEMQKLSADACSSWTSLLLVLISVLLTGTGIYPRLAKWGGAGALVPITGFANSVAAPAIEYKKEGQVFGIGCKIFTIAGPVILYGIVTSWALGLLYWVWTLLK